MTARLPPARISSRPPRRINTANRPSAAGNSQQLEPIKALLVAGDVQGIAQRFGVGGGGGGGAGGGGGSPFTAGRFNERPGETTPRAASATPSLPTAGGEGGGESSDAAPD